jgi:hypothetical protein
VSGRIRRTPGAAIMYHVAGSYTFTGSGLDLSTSMFAPCLLGRPGTGRQDPVLTSLRLAGLRYSSACHSIPVTQVFKKLPLSLLIRGFGVQVPGGAPVGYRQNCRCHTDRTLAVAFFWYGAGLWYRL